MINKLLEEFVELDQESFAYVQEGDYHSAVLSIHKGAKVQAKLSWILAHEGVAIKASGQLKQFVAGEFPLQRLISELNCELGGPDGTPEWSQLGWIADEHLSHVLDLEDADWPEPVNGRLLRLGVLITHRALPDWVLRHFRSVRRCYGLAMYDLVWISLRALIEAGSYEWLVQQKVVRHNQGVRDFAERSIRECLRLVEERGPVSGRQMDQLSAIVDRANHIIHSKRTADTPSEDETFKATDMVVRYLGRLFG